MKSINKVKKNIVKQSLLEGKSYSQSLLDAGYSKNSAHNAYRLNVVKCGLSEIEKEFKMSDVTVESVLRNLEHIKQLALTKEDFSTCTKIEELKGKYLAMFTEKREIKAEIVSKEEQDILNKYERISLIPNTPVENNTKLT